MKKMIGMRRNEREKAQTENIWINHEIGRALERGRNCWSYVEGGADI